MAARANRYRINNANRQRNREYVWQYLLEHPCVDCGFSDPRALQFDHVRGKKDVAISVMVSRVASMERLIAEIEKCDVRCANCHSIATHVRANRWSGPTSLALDIP